MENFFYELFESLPRQGVGDDDSTRKAFQKLTGLPEQPEILDVGCGTGKQTLVLAELTKAKITALDNHQPFIDTLQRNADQHGYGDRIRCIVGDMNAMSFPKESFDVIWSEGSIFIIGFEKGLRAWRPLLRPEGYLVVSELIWLTKEPPQEIRDFFGQVYPDMKFYQDIYSVIESAGYRKIDSFQFPDTSWWTDFYTPAEKNLPDMRRRYQDNTDAQAFYDAFQMEIEMHRKYSQYYGYGFYIMKKESA
ncbi:class I SAM-dependent methyltransferase [bacterium]|nr:class I SAM-dependent methyltransferase [bacterium]MBU1937908.1 class I SAM-dependent methyltransferase [bacterium]